MDLNEAVASRSTFAGDSAPKKSSVRGMVSNSRSSCSAFFLPPTLQYRSPALSLPPQVVKALILSPPSTNPLRKPRSSLSIPLERRRPCLPAEQTRGQSTPGQGSRCSSTATAHRAVALRSRTQREAYGYENHKGFADATSLAAAVAAGAMGGR